MRWRNGTPLLALCLAGVVTGGCEMLKPILGGEPETSPAVAETAPDTAETRLAEAAARAERALTALVRIRAAETPPPADHVPMEVPAALRRPVTLDWIGPLDTLAATLARRTGYRFVGAGTAPVRPVMVAIEAANRPLIEVLRDAGIQAGSAATLTVDAEERTVRLDWSGDHPGAGERPGTGDHPGTTPGSGGT